MGRKHQKPEEIVGKLRQVPAIFPPVMIDVESGGQKYQEMHVDGGAVAQLFLYPARITEGRDLRRGPLARERRAWVIRNARLDPDWASTQRSALSIAGRAISSMIHYSGSNDILRVQATAARDGVDFNLAYIGPEFTPERKENFDTEYMRALFKYGYDKAKAGYRWNKRGIYPVSPEVAEQ